MVELRNVSAGYLGRVVLEKVSLTVRPGKLLVLLGPNGCGKSTLLKTIPGLLPALGGTVLLDGKPLRDYAPRQIARRIACLPQSRMVPSITARRMVLHGRFPHLSYPRRYRKEDYAAVDRALALTDAVGLADRPLPELSGGQRQKVYLAMALAQEAETILLDEPTTYLDVRHQLETLALTRRLAEEGRAVVLVLHDLCLALSLADEIAVLGAGAPLDGSRLLDGSRPLDGSRLLDGSRPLDRSHLLALGPPEEIFQSRVLERVMGVRLDRAAGRKGWRYFCELPEEEE